MPTSQKAIRAQTVLIRKWTNEQKKANGGKMPEGKKPKLERMQAELARLRKSAPPKYSAAHTLADSGDADIGAGAGASRGRQPVARRRQRRCLRPAVLDRGRGRRRQRHRHLSARRRQR